MDKVWIEITGDNPLVGTMVAGRPASPGDKLQVPAEEARKVIAGGRAVLCDPPVAAVPAPDPVAATVRGRTR